MCLQMTQRPRHQDDWRTLSTINLYRCLIIFGLLGTQMIPTLHGVLVITLPALFTGACLIYLCLSAVAIVCTMLRWPRIQRQVFVFVTFDIGLLACIMLASSGMAVVLSLLLCVFVGCAGALLRVGSSLLIALLATLAILGQEALQPLLSVRSHSTFFQAGMLGTLFFLITGLSQQFGRRVRSNQAIVAAHTGTLRNLTELNRRIIEQMEIGTVVLDETHHIQLANAAAVRMLQLDQPPAQGIAINAVSVALTDALNAWLRHSGAATPAIEVGECTLLPSFSVLPVFSGRHAEANLPMLVFLEDAERQNEQAHNLKLAALGQLSAGIAHEIRNPLSAISHATQLLSESKQLTETDRKLLDMIYRHSRRIDNIVEDVMGLSRLENGEQPQLQLRTCLEQSVAEYRQQSEDPAEVSLERVGAGQSVLFDPDHLHRVLFNLCANAEKHARRPGIVLRIRMAGSYNKDNTFCLNIMDNGPGIDAETTNRVLEPFYTTSTNGIGLGLHVARKLCESNGARLKSIASANGACFQIVFSVAPPHSRDHA